MRIYRVGALIMVIGTALALQACNPPRSDDGWRRCSSGQHFDSRFNRCLPNQQDRYYNPNWNRNTDTSRDRNHDRDWDRNRNNHHDNDWNNGRNRDGDHDSNRNRDHNNDRNSDRNRDRNNDLDHSWNNNNTYYNNFR